MPKLKILFCCHEAGKIVYGSFFDRRMGRADNIFTDRISWYF
jgi:hypothetical protein